MLAVFYSPPYEGGARGGFPLSRGVAAPHGRGVL
jgi:hypothetical protein